MAKTLGDLVVRLSAKTQGWTEAFQRAADSVAETADAVEELASKGAAALGDMSDGFLTLSAAAAGAFVLGAQGNRQMADAMKELEGVARTLAVEFGKELIPLVKDLTQLVKTGVAAWRNLSAEQKQLVVSGIKWAAILGTGLKVLERGIIFSKSFAEGTVAIAKTTSAMAPVVRKRFDSVAKGVAQAGDSIAKLGKANVGSGFSSMAASMKAAVTGLPAAIDTAKVAVLSMGTSFTTIAGSVWAAVAPVLAVAAAVGALVLVAAVLYDAWKHADTGLSESFAGISKSVGEAAGRAMDVMSSLFQSFVEFVKGVAAMMLEVIAERVRAVAAFGMAVANKLGKTEWAKNLQAVLNLSGAGMVNLISSGLSNAADVFTEKMKAARAVVASIGSKVGAGAKDIGSTAWTSITRGLNSLGEDTGLFSFMDKLQAKLDGLSGIAPTPEQVNAVRPTETLDDIAKEAEKALQFEKDMQKLAEAAAADSKAEYVASVRAENAAAAENFRDLARMADDARRQIEDARRSLIDRFMSRLGDLGDIIDSAAKGFEAGGVWGAVIAAVAEFLTRSEGFATLIGMVNKIITVLADAFGALFTPMQPLFGAVMMIVQVIANILTPILSMFGEWLRQLAPIVAIVGMLLAGMMPLFQIIISILKAFFSVVTLFMNDGLAQLFNAIRILSFGILNLVRGISFVWNEMIRGVQGVLLGLANAARKIPFVGDDIYKALIGIASDLSDHRVDMGSIIKAIDDMENLTWDKAMDAATNAAWKLKDSMSALNSEVLNAPAMWKRSLAAANAQAGQASPYATRPSTGGTTPAPAASTPTGAAAAAATGASTIIYSYDPESTARAVERVNNGQTFRQRHPIPATAGA